MLPFLMSGSFYPFCITIYRNMLAVITSYLHVYCILDGTIRNQVTTCININEMYTSWQCSLYIFCRHLKDYNQDPFISSAVIIHSKWPHLESSSPTEHTLVVIQLSLRSWIGLWELKLLRIILYEALFCFGCGVYNYITVVRSTEQSGTERKYRVSTGKGQYI